MVPVSEAARMLGVSTDTVRRMVRRGALRSTQDARGRLLVDASTGAQDARAHDTQNDTSDAVAAQLREELERERAAARAWSAECDAWRAHAQKADEERCELLRTLLGVASRLLAATESREMIAVPDSPHPNGSRRTLRRLLPW